MAGSCGCWKTALLMLLSGSQKPPHCAARAIGALGAETDAARCLISEVPGRWTPGYARWVREGVCISVGARAETPGEAGGVPRW